MKRLRDLLHMPGAAGVALAAVCIPLILLLPGVGILVALVALCLYPVLDVPRTLARPSWWRAAMVSASVWVLLFVTLAGVVETVQPMGDNAMVFLLPFMLYPVILAISGIVCLEGNLQRRPKESAPRRAAIAVWSAAGLIVIGPLVGGMIPMLIEQITGNTRANFSYTGEGEVVSYTPDVVSVRLTDATTESFRLNHETRFNFNGPGSAMIVGEAGPAWLKPGQRIVLDYLYRGGEAQSDRISIWIERKGCAGDEKWIAATQTPPSSAPAVPSLTGTTWEGLVGERNVPGAHTVTVLEFMNDNVLASRDQWGTSTDAHWRQDGATVLIEVNDCYAKYEGQIEGDEIKGEFSNEMGARAVWTARRQRVSVSTTPPK